RGAPRPARSTVRSCPAAGPWLAPESPEENAATASLHSLRAPGALDSPVHGSEEGRPKQGNQSNRKRLFIAVEVNPRRRNHEHSCVPDGEGSSEHQRQPANEHHGKGQGDR